MAITDNGTGAYKFTESNGSNAVDATGNGNTLTNTGSVAYASNFAIFDGTNKQLGIASALGYTSVSDMTWALWIVPTGVPTTDQFPIDVCTNSGANRRMIFNLTGAAHLTPNLYVSGNTFSASGTYATLVPNTLYCIIITIVSGTATMYINNVSQGTVSVGTTASSTNFFSLGTDFSISGGENFIGKIISPVALTRGWSSGERTQYYNGGTPILWPFSSGIPNQIVKPKQAINRASTY